MNNKQCPHCGSCYHTARETEALRDEVARMSAVVKEYSEAIRHHEAKDLERATAGDVVYRLLAYGATIPENAVFFDDTSRPYDVAIFKKEWIGAAFDPDSEHHDMIIMIPAKP